MRDWITTPAVTSAYLRTLPCAPGGPYPLAHLLRFGWAFLANKAVWHSKGKVKAYGELFRTGDTVTVILDLDSGELHGLRLYQLGLPL